MNIKVIRMNAFLQSRFFGIVRWIAAFPLALSGAAVVFWFNELIFSSEPAPATASLLVVMLLYALAGYAFTAIGVYVVPDHKRTVSIVLSALLAVAAIAAAFFLLPGLSGWEILDGVVRLLALIGGASCMTMLYCKEIVKNR